MNAAGARPSSPVSQLLGTLHRHFASFAVADRRSAALAWA